LKPDYDHRFITAGYGALSPTTTDYVGAAMNEGSLGIAYCPRRTTVTADVSRFSGPVTARWYDPTSGAFHRKRASGLRNRGARRFQTPGRNHAGDEDWVLVVET
jgi:hypothetical protein